METMTKKEIAQESFRFFAEALARTGMFEGLEMPIFARARHGRPNDFPCIDTDEDRLREENRARDQRDRTQREPVTILPIDTGRYYVALPRTVDHIQKRAVQLLEACLRLQEER